MATIRKIPYQLPVMNLGELIVDLSLDYAEFNQSLEQAKKAASNAAASIEKSFQKLSLTIEVDDSALYDLNKHLDLKYRHFKEVNQYFKNNPLAPTVDDGELTELNKTLKELTQNKHTVTIEQRINAKLTDSSKRQMADSVSEGVADGVEEGVAKGLHDMDKMIAKAVTDGIKAGSKSFNGSGSSGGSSGRGKQEGIEDIVGELKSGFGDLQKQIGNSLIGDVLKTVLKPAKDLITGFSEGISNDLGKQMSKGLQQTFAKQLGMDFKKMGEQAGNNLLGAFGIKVKKENKLLNAIGDGSQIAIKSLSKSVERYAVRKLNKALTDSLDSMFTELFSGDFSVSKQSTQKATSKARQAIAASRITPPSTQATRPSRINIPIDEDEKPSTIPVNIPVVKKPAKIPLVDIKQKAEKVLLENTFTPFEKAAHESNKQFGYVLNEIGKINVKNSIVGGGNQTVKRVATEITKIKTAHQKAYSTFKNLLESAKDLGDYGLVDQIYRDFIKNSQTAKTKIDELLKEGKAAGLTQHGYNKLATAKSGISRSIGKSSGSIPSKYQAVGRQAEGEAVAIGKNVVAGLGIGADNKAFARFGLQNATAYLLAIKKAFAIQSPSKVMMGIGKNIVEGLSLGLSNSSGLLNTSVQKTSDKIKEGFQKISIMSSKPIGKVNDIIDNVYADSLGKVQTTLPGVILGTGMMSAAKLGLVPNSINAPVKHLGAYYQGATNQHNLSEDIGKQSAIGAVYSSMLNHALKTRNLNIPDNFEVGQGTVGNAASSQMPQLHYTLGGYQYNRTKNGGLRTNDVYDWTHDHNKITEFATPKQLGSKVASIFEKMPILPKLIGIEYDKQLDAYVKRNKQGETLFGFSKSAKNKDLLLGDAIHNTIGGKPYIQSYEIDKTQLADMQKNAQKAFNEVQGDPVKFFKHDLIQQYTKQLPKQGFKDIGINLITSLGAGIFQSEKGIFGILIKFGGTIISTVKRLFGIASPSKVMMSIGFNIVQGLLLGITQAMPMLKNVFSSINQSIVDTKNQGGATLGQFVGNAAKAGSSSLLGSMGIGSFNLGSAVGALKGGQMSAILPQLLPLLIPIIGLKGLNLGDTIVKILNNNLAIKPGFLNDLFKSLTGIKLEKTGFISAVTNTLGISKGSQSPITSPVEVINKQISQNLGSVGTGGSVSKLVENTGQMLVSAVLKQFGVSGAVGVAIEAMVKGRIANIANLGIFTNTGGKGIGGRVRGIAESYSQGDVDGVIGKSSKLAGTILRTIGFKVDMKQLTLVMGTAIAGITAFHKAFAEEGLGLGQALIKGFKEAQKNWGNAFDDMKTNAKKAMGMDVLGDLAGNIVKKVKQGTVVSREAFSELFDELGKTFKNKALGGDKQGIFGNILGFGASISTMIAPITTMAASLLPLLIPLMPVLGAIGGIAVMVGGKIAGLANAIKEVEPLQRRLNFLGGSPAGGDREMKYAQGVANKLNVPVKEGIQAYSQLAIAARGTKLEGDGVRELYEGISASLGALGISGQDASLVFMAYTQILAKGKLSMEELRQQLGEKFPPTMGVFAKSLGVSVGELNQLVGKGAILSEDILPKVAKTLNEDYGKAAANSAGSFTVALTKLGNVGFDIAIKLTKAFGGTFAMFANVGANALGMFRDTLDQLLPLFNSLMIGVTAVVGVGLATILSASPIAKFLATVQNLITAGLGALMVNLAPFYIGIIADVADGWLGAQNDLMDNMMRGVGNMAVAMATALDNLNRTFTGKSLFSDIVGKKEAGNPFQGIIDGFGSLFKLIPPGVVELGALVLMFEQVQVLFKMFLWPTILGGWKSFSNVLVNFANMAKPIGTILSELLVNTTGLMRGMGSGKLKFGETFGNAWKSGLAAIGTGLKALTPLAIEAALALGVLLFAKSDFTNPISDSIGKMATGINSAIKSINGSLDDLANKFDNAGKSARDMANNLPSKGMELNVQYALGLGGKSFKSDDFINQANASEGFGGNIQRSLIRSFSGGLNNLNPIYNAKSLASILGYQETPESVKQNKIDADKYGIGKYFTGKETTTNLAQTQLLNQVKDIQLNKDGLNKFFSDTGLTAGTDFSKNVKQAANQVRELDKQLFSLGQKRSKLGSLNTSASKVQIAELDKQLMVLEKQRGVAAKEIVNIDAQVKEVGAFDPKTGELASGWLKDTMDAIRDNKEMPLDVRMKLIADLKPMEDAIRTASQKIAKLPVDPLKEIYQTTISALRDFEVVYDKFLSTNKIGVANRQEALYSSGTNQGNLNQGLSFIGLQEQEQQKDALSKLSAIRKRSFDNLNSITNFGKTDEQKKELDDLRKAIKDDNENLAKMGADIAKSRRDIRQTLVDQTKQVADYYRTAVREAQAVSIEFQKAQKTLENSRMQNKLREALIGAGDNIYTQFIEGIINIISQTADIEKQQLEAKKQRIDYENNVQDIRLQAAELQRSLPGKIIPLDSSMADNFNLSLEEINGTVGTINGSVKDVANSLSNDVVEAAKKANAELDKLNGTFKNLQSVTDNWIDGFGNKITDVLGKLNLTVGVTANVVTNTPAWAANASSILQGLPINTSSATSPINTGKTIFDPQTINEGVKAAAKFNTQANMCAASVKAFTDKVGINTKAMDLTADSSKRVGTVMTDFSKIKPGDLIGWSGTSRFGDEHIGVYIDGQKIFHQSGSTGKKPGVYNDFDYFKKQKGAYFVRPFESVFNTTNAAAQKQQRQPVPKVPPVPLQTAQVGKQQSGGVLWGKAANYAPSNLSGLTARGKKAMAALQNPNVRAFLDAVAVAEVGEKVAAQGGYGYLIGDDIKGRESFDPNQLGSHPGRRVRYGKGKNQVSSATGRYQTMDFVAKEEFGRLGLKDFKPQSQEILAVSRLMYRGVLEDIKKGNFSSVITRKGNMDASSEWASLQGNPYGQGSPTGKTSVFVSNIQRNLQMLNAASAQGKFIDPNSMQQAVNQAGRLKLNTAAQQLQTNQINSNLSPEQIKENELKQRLEAYRFIRSTRKSALGDISSTKDSTLGTQRTVLEGLSPNMSNADRFGIQLADLRRKIEKDIEALQQIIDDTDGAIAQKPDLQAAFNLAMKRFPNDPKLAADAIQTNDLTFKATAFRNAEAKNNLAFLKSNVDDILKASIADFDKKEFFRLSEQDIAQQTKVIEQLQQQLQSIQKLEEIDPLNPLVLKIPSLQKNIDLLSLNRDQYQQLLDLQKRYYEGGGKGGNMSEEAFQKEFKAILSVNSIKKEGIDLNFNYANTVKKIEQATKELAKAELIQASQMKSLQLDNERFAIDNRNGLVSIIGLTNELTMKTNELTNAYKRQLLEIEGNNLLNKPGDKLRETLKADRAFQMGLSNIQTEFAFKGKEAELVTNPQVELDTSSKMFDLLNQNKFDLRSSNIETLKSGMANEFYTNRLTRDLETEKEVERARRAKEQLKIDIEKNKLENIGSPEKIFNADQIREMSAALDELNKKKLDDITKSAQTFDMALKKVFQENLINGLTSGFTELINGTKSFGDVLNDLANNILNGVLNIALNSLLKSAFGGGGLFGGIFGFNKGGIVPNFADGGVIGAIGDALQRERQASGVKPVLAALTPGERVLTVRQNKRFEELQMERVLNYVGGGVVGSPSTPNMNFSAPAQSSTVNVSVPVNINGGQGDTSVNVPQLQNAVRSAVLAEIQKQQRPGGALGR